MKTNRQSIVGCLLTLTTSLALVGGTSAKQVKLEAAMAEPLMLAEKKKTTFLKIGLTGFEFAKRGQERSPVNVAIVLDKSSSMGGEKIKKAREAAKMAVRRLGDDDIVSVVLYDSTVRVLVPATKVSDKEAICAQIDKISAGGSTALFAGVTKGAAEIRKFIDRDRVNRVLLLSDGQANVGPSSPGALAELGGSLIKEGISVSTIGLGSGYNEDLMFKLADRSDGNHAFAENGVDLVRIFDAEFGEILSVVAQEVLVKVKCSEGIRPVRVLGREAEIAGQTATILLNQLYSKQEKYIVLEVEVPATRADTAREVASVEISYANMETNTTDRLASKVSVRFSKSQELVMSNTDKQVMASCVLQVATLTNDRAVTLRDEGKVAEARAVLLGNGTWLQGQATLWGSEELNDYGVRNSLDAEKLEGKDWEYNRKQMRDSQYKNIKQRGY